MIRGISITLYVETEDEPDAFGRPVVTETAVTVNNVLVAQPSTDDVIDSADLTGKRIEYVLGIPKGDTNDWKDKKVEFFGRTFKTYGFPVEGIEANVPTPWHKKVYVAAYE